MLTFLPYAARGTIASLLLGLNTALHCLPVFVIALAKLIVPLTPWRRLCSRLLNALASSWISVNSAWMRLTQDLDWQVSGGQDLSRDDWYLVTCNHQSWADIFIVQRLLNRRIPQMKFFLKQELIWVPVIGLCWWALDFPFMKRYGKAYLKKHPDRIGKDLETTQRACAKFRDVPVAVFNFMEGTRFTPDKHKRQSSPYRHLLKPKAGGTGYVLSAMGGQLSRLLDITINYGPRIPGFWDFLCGRVDRIEVHIETRPIPPELLGRDYNKDAQFRSDLQRWVKELWRGKDERLETMRGNG
ncbi:MAG: acyltransferase [Desulfuromonadales bacterium]|nr:acyltransferase [Desulfuromonadales bacterium]NIS43182.1 acyltransferase [Desulfuromonadales bacterium]